VAGIAGLNARLWRSPEISYRVHVFAFPKSVRVEKYFIVKMNRYALENGADTDFTLRTALYRFDSRISED
jgi:hypothetical protein